MPPPNALHQTGAALPSVIVADEAFPLTANIMRPYPGVRTHREPAGSSGQHLQLRRLSRDRGVVENAFGILSQKWRIFRRPLNVTPEHACAIIRTVCILPNYVRDHGQPGSQQLPQADASGAQVGGLCELGGLGANNFSRVAGASATTSPVTLWPREPSHGKMPLSGSEGVFVRHFVTGGAVRWQAAADRK